MARTLASDVCERLRADILKGRLRPGTRLRFEDLKAGYGVGISPLREALMRLASEGLVVSEEHRGFHVAPVSRSKLLDITFMRKELEGMALRLAIENGDDRWESQIVSTFHALAKRSKAGDNGSLDPEWEARHRAFHLALVSACGSEWLLQFRTMLYDQWDRYRRLCVQYTDHPRNVLEEHRELMQATIDRDAAAAVYLLQKHITQSTKILIAADASLIDDRAESEPADDFRKSH